LQNPIDVQPYMGSSTLFLSVVSIDIALILLNIVIDMLSILIKRAKDDGQIRAIIPHLVEDGLSIFFQYADDTILFMDHDVEKEQNLGTCCFVSLKNHQVLRLTSTKVIFFCYGETKRRKHEYTEFFGCDTGSYLFVYLGIPL